MNVEGIITLPLVLGEKPRQTRQEIDFLVVNVPSAYNGILGRPGLNAARAVVSTYHLCVKFPTEHGEGEVKGNQQAARNCYVSAFKQKQKVKETLPIEPLQVEGLRPDQRAEPMEELEKIPLGDDPTRTVQIGGALQPEIREEFINFLRTNADVFAWEPADMPGIEREIQEHKLAVSPVQA